jgi:prepilin-type N-terminal cleavage/methylation domain-containing protein
MKKPITGIAGFTLTELLVTLVIAVCLGALAIPAYSQLKAISQGQRCNGNLLLIEAAKDSFVKDNPGQALTSTSQLLPYLKYGMPTCPAGGTYSNVTDPYTRTACSADNGVVDGLHDYGTP